jgi:hypothetical protein
MMYGAGEGEPEPTVEVHDYYRYIYKHVEMVWEQEAQEEIYLERQQLNK